jgi:hypothetical protein
MSAMTRTVFAIALAMSSLGCSQLPRPVDAARAERAASQPAQAPKDATDAAIFKALRDAGHDFSKPTIVEFFAYFPDEASARGTVQVLSGKGYSGEVRRSESEWLCQLRKTMVLNADAIDMERFLFRDLTVNSGGRYDGWQAQVAR